MSESKGFDPRPHMSEMTRKARTKDGGWREVKTEYLEVKWRLVWLRSVDPKANITTTIHEVNDKYAVVHCSIGLTDGGYGSGVGMCFRDKWDRHLEKSETTALGRALATLGFGTQFCGDEFDEDGAIADSPVDQPQQRPPSREPGQPTREDGLARPATEPQIKAIYAIARGAHQMDDETLERIVREKYGCAPADLSRRNAAEFIDTLKMAPTPPSREPMPQSAAVPHATGPGDISDPQRKAIFAIGGKLGMDEAKVNEFVGAHFKGLTVSGLSRQAASVIIQKLQERLDSSSTMPGMPAVERRRE